MPSERRVMVGGVPVGGGAPVVVQSMTNTRTDDVEATLGQIRALATAGAGLVRVAVPDRGRSGGPSGAGGRVARSAYRRRALRPPSGGGCPGAGAAGVRINPGQYRGAGRGPRGGGSRAQSVGAVIRVGVNSGSLQRDLRELEETDPAGALVESAVRYCALMEELGFREIKVSVKSSSPLVDHRGQPPAGASACPIRCIWG